MLAHSLLITVPLFSVAIWVALGAIVLRGKGDQASGTEFRGTSFCVAAAALQFLIVSLAVAIEFFVGRLGGETVILLAICWPILLLTLTAPLLLEIVKFSVFGLPLVFGAAAMPLVAGIYWTTMPGWLRNFWPTVAVLTFFAMFMVTGEWQLRSRLVKAGAELNPECMDAASFLQSIKNGTWGNGFSLHAAARKAGKLYAWSYRKNSFYVVPESAVGNVRVSNSSWFSLPYPSCGLGH